MKTKYLIPQTEAMLLQGERPMCDFIASPEATPAPERGYAPGGGDLGGVPN